MSIEMTAAIIVVVLAALGVGGAIWARLPKKLKNQHFVTKWKELQTCCKDKNTWPEAITQADNLLGEALKKRKFKGKSMGERMVSAQRTFSDNDMAWFAHNLYKKLKSNPEFKLKESDVKDALIGFRQALRDLGALPESQVSQSVKVKK